MFILEFGFQSKDKSVGLNLMIKERDNKNISISNFKIMKILKI